MPLSMTWLSYLLPITIYRKETSRGSLIEVREMWGERKLDMNGYPQSNRGYRRLWTKVLKRANALDLPPQATGLILGLGGGDTVKILGSDYTVTVVELEAEVVRVAREYFGIKSSPTRSILIQDAKDFVARNHTKYDLVIVDVYDGDGIPLFVRGQKFLKDICRASKPTGKVIINYASHSFKERDFTQFEKKLKQIFPQVELIKIGGHTFYTGAVSRRG